MSEEQVKVKVVSEDEETLVIETPDGKEETFYLNPIRSMRLKVEELQLMCGANLYHMGGEIGELPAPAMRLQGTASLGRSSISIIGEPMTGTDTLAISFKALNEAEQLQSEEWSRKYEKPVRYTGVSVGFIRSDWEIGNGDDWFVECQVSEATFKALVSAVEAGTLNAVSLGISLANIYTDDNWAPPSVSADWFLRPDRDNPGFGPEMARGDIVNLDMALTKVGLRPPEPAEEKPEEPQPSYDEVPEVSANTLALQRLGTNIEKLQGTVRVVGGLIAFVLFIWVMKGS